MLRIFIFILSFSAMSTVATTVMYDFDCPTDSRSKTLNQFCMKGAVDDAIMVAGGALLFKGDKVALHSGFDTRTFAKGYPMLINELFSSLPANIDAAFTYTPTGKIYIMKGSTYWRYSGNGSINNSLDDGFPRPISEGFRGVPDNVDAAVEWGNFIYFFKDDIYYKFQPCKNLSYVGPINELPGVPDDIDGVVRYPNGHVYFFKGDLYYDFEVNSNKVIYQPHVVSWEWFRCYEKKP